MVSISTAMIAGHTEFASQAFPWVKSILRSSLGRTGGAGLKIHPDFLYRNLYHWLLDDDTFWQRASVPLPASRFPFYEAPTNIKGHCFRKRSHLQPRQRTSVSPYGGYWGTVTMNWRRGFFRACSIGSSSFAGSLLDMTKTKCPFCAFLALAAVRIWLPCILDRLAFFDE